MSVTDDAAIRQHLEAETVRVRAAYLDLMGDSLVGGLNEDPGTSSTQV